MALRTVPWKTVYERAVNLCGLVPAQVTVQDFAYLQEAIDQRSQYAWEYFWWPELMRVQERFYRDAFDPLAVYAAGAEVYWTNTDSYYRRLSAGTGIDPSDPLTWELLTELDAYVALEQPGKDAIGEVRRVTRRNPRLELDAGPMPFELTDNGVQLVEEAPKSVYVDFRIPPQRYLGPDFDETVIYAGGERVYSPDRGDYFDLIAAGLGSTINLDDPAQATRVLYPRLFESFVSRATYADWLANEGQVDKARLELERAMAFLDREFDKLAGQQQQTQRYQVRNTGAQR